MGPQLCLSRGPTLSYHKHRTIGLLTLLPSTTSSGACLCKGAAVAFGDAKGTLEYTPAGTGSMGSSMEQVMCCKFHLGEILGNREE